MSTLTLFVICGLVVAAVALAVYSVAGQRRRKPPALVTINAPISDGVPSAQTRAVPLPGIPPKYEPPVTTWAAVERKLQSPRAGRGSKPPPPTLSANRFDQVLTTGLPVVVPARAD
ncbi:MAG: hypothetical protein H0T42_05975 [Deltaproteobacteria bacterium]|nr:hypothetical protein [Deltaproteobacteria bacterium]